MLRLLKMILKATGKKGVPQGGVISPLLSNLYLDKDGQDAGKGQGDHPQRQIHITSSMLVMPTTWSSWWTPLPQHDWLMEAVNKRLREELAKLHVEVNKEKSRVVDLGKGERFGFLGFEFRRVRSRRGAWRPGYAPKLKKRTALLEKLRDIFRYSQSQPVGGWWDSSTRFCAAGSGTLPWGARFGASASSGIGWRRRCGGI